MWLCLLINELLHIVSIVHNPFLWVHCRCHHFFNLLSAEGLPLLNQVLGKVITSQMTLAFVVQHLHNEKSMHNSKIIYTGLPFNAPGIPLPCLVVNSVVTWIPLPTTFNTYLAC